MSFLRKSTDQRAKKNSGDFKNLKDYFNQKRLKNCLKIFKNYIKKLFSLKFALKFLKSCENFRLIKSSLKKHLKIHLKTIILSKLSSQQMSHTQPPCHTTHRQRQLPQQVKPSLAVSIRFLWPVTKRLSFCRRSAGTFALQLCLIKLEMGTGTK